MTRDEFRLTHPDVYLVDSADREGLTSYLRARTWLAADEPITAVGTPSDGTARRRDYAAPVECRSDDATGRIRCRA